MNNKESGSKLSVGVTPRTCSLLITYLLLFISLASCSIQKKISRSASAVIHDPSLETAHVGISIYEPAANKYWYEFNADKYFVPASNTKIPTCYAAMKYLGDSLVGLRYGIPEEYGFRDRAVVIQPTGDPTFLHGDYAYQPVFEFLLQKFLKEDKVPGIFYDGSKVSRWGNGWGWNDYQEPYMAERNIFPLSGNVITWKLLPPQQRFTVDSLHNWAKKFSLFQTGYNFFDSLLNNNIYVPDNEEKRRLIPRFSISRNISSNDFETRPGNTPLTVSSLPFVTDEWRTTGKILSDILKKKFTVVFNAHNPQYEWAGENGDLTLITINKWMVIHSQPTDSLLKPMMHRSDNFFAEQSLLMVSNELLGTMDDEKIIDTLLKNELKDLPQKPRWADGSGLSRYNLFSPKDLVFILNKMKNEFGMERLKVIFPTGGEGTLANYYVSAKDRIYVKTGSLSGIIALSGFLYTKKNKLLVFSVLVNNHRASASDVRRAVEKFLLEIRANY